MYGDFVEQVDAAVGRILDQLAASGVIDNTLVIVTSDNGAPWEKRDWEENGGHWANTLRVRGQKSDAYEGGHRIPFYVRWPGKVKAGTVSDQLICLTDIFATVAAASGAKLTEAMAEDSFNLVPVLTAAQRGPLRDSVVHHSGDGLFAIRQGEWKLIQGLGSGGFTPPAKIQPRAGDPEGQLYNLLEDPLESRNRYRDQPQTAARLSALLQKIQAAGRSR